MNIGIHGVGVYLPDDVRKNDWWPKEVVDRWKASARRHLERAGGRAQPESEGQRTALQAISEAHADPFQGSRERRVIADDMHSSDMEIAASQDLFSKVEVRPEQVDLLLVNSAVPDYLATNGACTLHHALGLPERCYTLSVEAVCNSFQQQMTLADAMIRAGQARYALLVQSSALSRILPYDQPHSAWFGDAATAVLVGPVADGRGLLGAAHRTDGSLNNMLVTSVPGKRWYQGPVSFYQESFLKGQRLLLGLPETSQEVISAALADAGVPAEEVGFYASHQGTCWLRCVTQRFAGLEHARTVDTFPWAASVIASNLPLVLATAEKDGLLRDGDLVVTYGGGSGVTWGSLVLRWGVG